MSESTDEKPINTSLHALKVVVSLLWLTYHTLLDKTRSYGYIRCYEAARIWCEALKFLGYEARQVDGFFDIRHRWYEHGIYTMGNSIIHSWIEIGDKIVETDPRQMFPEESGTSIAELEVIPKDDHKAGYYNEAKNHEDKELFSQFIERIGGINLDIVEELAKLLINHIKKHWTTFLSTHRRSKTSN